MSDDSPAEITDRCVKCAGTTYYQYGQDVRGTCHHCDGTGKESMRVYLLLAGEAPSAEWEQNVCRRYARRYSVESSHA